MDYIRYNSDFVESIKSDEALKAGRQKYCINISAPETRALKICGEAVDIVEKLRAPYLMPEMDSYIIISELFCIVSEILIAITVAGFKHLHTLFPTCQPLNIFLSNSL